MEVNIHRQTDLNTMTELKAGHFPEGVFNDLPLLIRNGTERLAGNDKEVFLVGSLAALSSILPNVQAIYDGQALESNLYFFLIGQYGSGKGTLRYARNLVSPVHKYLKESEILPDPQTGILPPKKLHFLPANSSKSGFIELLANNGRGLIYSTEADTLTDIFKQEYGNFSEILRQAYHHEPFEFYRRNGKEHYEKESAKLSVLLSGTPTQLRKLITGIENGLLSRFCYFKLETETTFKNVFETNDSDLNSYFKSIGEALLPLYQYLITESEPSAFILTDNQEAVFLAYFQELKTDLIDTYGEIIAGNVNRFGVQFFRLAMILTVIRNFENEALYKTIHCSDIDFQNTKRIMEVFIFHALQVFENLANSLDHLPKNKRTLFESLPKEFTTAEAVSKGQELSIPERTVKRFLTNNQLFECLRHGQYKRKK
jgi:hypothetical protein